MCDITIIEQVSDAVNNEFEKESVLAVQLKHIKSKIEKSMDRLVSQCKQNGICDENDIKNKITESVMESEMKDFDFLPMLKKVQFINKLKGM